MVICSCTLSHQSRLQVGEEWFPLGMISRTRDKTRITGIRERLSCFGYSSQISVALSIRNDLILSSATGSTRYSTGSE